MAGGQGAWQQFHTNQAPWEGERRTLSDKRRIERNNREQKRSKQISDQIKELKTILEEAGVNIAKGSKSAVLSSAADYIEELRELNAALAAQSGSSSTWHGGRDAEATDANADGDADAPQGSAKPDDSDTATASNMMDVSESHPFESSSSQCSHGASSRYELSASASTVSDTVSIAGKSDLMAEDHHQDAAMGGDGVGDSTSGEIAEAKSVRYDCVFHQQAVAMAITAVDGRFIECNKRFEEESGYTREELMRMSCFTLASADDDGNSM